MITTLEKAIQESMTRPRLSEHHTSFKSALCQELVRSTTYRVVTCSGAGLPFSEIVGFEHQSLELIHHPGVDPLLAPAEQGGSRARLIGYSPIGAAEHQYPT